MSPRGIRWVLIGATACVVLGALLSAAGVLLDDGPWWQAGAHALIAVAAVAVNVWVLRSLRKPGGSAAGPS